MYIVGVAFFFQVLFSLVLLMCGFYVFSSCVDLFFVFSSSGSLSL